MIAMCRNILGRKCAVELSGRQSIYGSTHHSVVRHFRMSKKGKKNLTGAMAGMSLEDGGSDGSDEEMEHVEVRISQR